MKLRVWRVVMILAVGCGLGFAWNAFSGHGFALDANAYIRPGDEVVEIDAARRRWEAGALFLDARGGVFYQMGHVPGALSLPEEEFEAAFARIEAQLRGRFDIIVYCSGFGCEASHIVARKLKERGVPAAILNEGWPAWTDADLPVREGAAP